MIRWMLPCDVGNDLLDLLVSLCAVDIRACMCWMQLLVSKTMCHDWSCEPLEVWDCICIDVNDSKEDAAARCMWSKQCDRVACRSIQNHWASHVHHGQHTLFNSASVFARARSGANTVARGHHACNCMQPCSTSSCRQTKRTHRPACHADVVFVPSATGSPDAAWYVPINPWCCRYDGAVPDALAALTAHSASADVTDITRAVVQTVLLRQCGDRESDAPCSNALAWSLFSNCRMCGLPAFALAEKKAQPRD